MTEEQKQQKIDELKHQSDKGLQDKVVAMELMKLEIKKFYEESDMLLQEIAHRTGIQSIEEFHFQDDMGTVYQLARWPGQFVVPKDYVIQRTRMGDERAGTLSLTGARDLGYEVEGQRAKPKKETVPESETAGHPEGK